MLLAHSADPKYNVVVQPYPDHANGVYDGCMDRLKRLRNHLHPRDAEILESCVPRAALFHDLGKVDANSQTVLRGESSGKIINHCDAGVAYLLSLGGLENRVAAWLVCAHHIGLSNMGSFLNWDWLRDYNLVHERCPNFPCKRGMIVKDHVDEHLDVYLRNHKNTVGDKTLPSCDFSFDELYPALIRLGLSILVDSDWTDTAKNYKNLIVEKEIPLRNGERFEVLSRYVDELQRNAPANERNLLRQLLFEETSDSAICSQVAQCCAVVGMGKTLSCLAYALNTGCDRIIYSAPYTTILDQNIEEARKSMCLPGEDPCEVVVACHSQPITNSDGDLEPSGLRKLLSSTFAPPCVFTSHVRTYETMFSNKPRNLRRFWRMAGSCFLLDESHSMKISLWPLAMQNLFTLVDKFDCHVVFMSGSMTKPWTKDKLIREMSMKPPEVKDIVSDKTMKRAIKLEKSRVDVRRLPGELGLDDICKLVTKKKYCGPKVVILNTVKNAAMVALELRSIGIETIHLSASLSPSNRMGVIKRVEEALKEKRDFVLVSTSCIECGINFSFKFGFREMSEHSSHIQSSGRVNRDCDYVENGVLFIFETKKGDFTTNPAYIRGSIVYDRMFRKGKVSPEDSDLHFKGILNISLDPLKNGDDELSVEELMEAEKNFEFEKVCKYARLISDERVTVLVKPDILDGKFSSQDLAQNSVTIFPSKADKLYGGPITNSPKYPDILVWDEDSYDPEFLGYMKFFLN